MERAPLGRSGITVSRLALGGNNFGWRLDPRATRAVVDTALDVGVNFIDTADMYGRNAPRLPSYGLSERGDSERLLGRALAGRRDRVVLATKFGADMGDGVVARGAPAYMRRAVEGSLGRLATDYIDVLYYHRLDGVTPLSETVGAMRELVREGKVRALGCSDLDEQQLREVGADIAALQNRFHLLDRADAFGVLPACVQLGVGYVPFSPLADGILSGKYGMSGAAPAGSRLSSVVLGEDVLGRLRRLVALARELDRTLLELALGWLCSQPAIPAVVAGATSPEQVRANAKAVARGFAPDELGRITTLIEIAAR